MNIGKSKRFLLAIVPFILAIILLPVSNLNAQGCASTTLYKMIGSDSVELSAIDRNGGIQLTCDTSEIRLVAFNFAPGYVDPEQGYYTFERIPYNPPAAFNAGDEIHLAADDSWSRLFSFDNYFPVPETSDTPAFRFHFYEDDRSALAANSNGGVVFFCPQISNHLQYTEGGVQHTLKYNDPNSSDYLYCPYSTSQPLPDTRQDWGSDRKKNPMFNSINAPYQDIYFSENSFPFAKMYINFIGEYPCRKCVLSYYDVPMFGYTSDHHTSMIVLYETTNVIEFYIQDKPLHTSTNGGNAILGIQNLDGSHAVTITNDQYAPNGGTPTTKSYNNTVWEAHNEAWRIKPTGNLTTTQSWFKKPTNGPQAGQMIGPLDARQATEGNLSYSYCSAQPAASEGDTWYYSRLTVTRAQVDADGNIRTFDVWDSVLIHPLDVPDIFISHNSYTNQTTIENNNDSLEYRDTVCMGENVLFRITGADTAFFVEPNTLANTRIINNSVIVQQPTNVDSVVYKFCVINNDSTGDEICRRYESCVIYNRSFTVDLGPDTNICVGNTISYNDLTNREGDNHIYTYSYKYGDLVVGSEDTLNYIPQNSGILKLTMTDEIGCKASDEANVNIHQYPEVHIDGNRDVCNGSSTVLTAKANTEPNTYIWDDDDSTATAAVEVSPDITKSYTVQVSYSSAKCMTQKSVTINVVPYPDIHCDEDQRICEGANSLVSVTGKADHYLWKSLDLSVEGQTGKEYEVTPEGTTTYTVTAYNNDSLQCTSKDSMTVFVARKPIVTMKYSPEYVDELTPQVVFADSTAGITERLWELGDGYQTDEKVFLHVFDLDDTTQRYDVVLVGTTQDGCVDSAITSLPVRREHHLWAPNAVYLHDVNQSNRTFRVHIDNLKDFSLKIFDRWGTLMFETDDPEQAWDCTYKGENVPQGVYAWIAVYHHTDSPKREMRKSGELIIYN